MSWAALDDLAFEPASFRDPAARILERDGRILRVIGEDGAGVYTWVRDRSILDAAIRAGQVIPTREIPPGEVGLDRTGVRHVLEHERVPFVSYPYEWCFSALQAAALLHLDLHLALLERGATLVDASAYNVQFRGAKPVFIDVLSLRPYEEGALWAGHRQFCEQFLNPLLLQARRGVPFNAWYRGAMEGVPGGDLAALLSWRDKASWRVLAHVVAPARLQRAAESRRVDAAAAVRSRPRPLSRGALVAMLKGLRAWIDGLRAPSRRGGWTAYTATRTYSATETAAKEQFVAEFASACRPALLLDLGCNTGEYAQVALASGARAVVGLEGDPATADEAFRQSAGEGRAFLPLVMDAADPSPSRGWRETERRSLSARARFDALLALAFEHHLAIGRNVPLPDVVAWITGLAPRGVVEFVEKSDPTIQQMLALREDVFHDYSLDRFTQLLARSARIVRQETVSASGRVLFWYER